MDRKRLLVVDDEPQIGELLFQVFDSQYDVLTARSGEEAIKRAVTEQPHCILMDVMMPQMGGFVLCEILKSIKQTQLIPILMVSSKPRKEVWGLAQEIGAFDYVEKPFSINRICTAVHRALNEAPTERRRAPRIKMKIPIIVRGKNALQRDFEVFSETEDVSQVGALIQLPFLIPIGTRVELSQAYFPPFDKIALTTRARIVWNNQEGDSGPYLHGLEYLSPATHWVAVQ